MIPEGKVDQLIKGVENISMKSDSGIRDKLDGIKDQLWQIKILFFIFLLILTEKWWW